MPPRVIHDFVKGKKTGPSADPIVHPVVVAIPIAEAGEFLGTRDMRERTRHLQSLRQLGVLVHGRNCLTQRVVIGRTAKGYPVTERFVVFKVGDPADVPRFRRERRGPQISYW